jgi:homoserine dehydrogenase
VQIALALVGYGHVARRFVQLLDESRDALAALGIEPIVVGIATRRHGSVFDAAGVNAAEFERSGEHAGLDTAAAGKRLGGSKANGPSSAALAIIDQLGALPVEARVMVETTVLDIQLGQPAIEHVRAAFAAGAHVITANKGPAAFAYRALSAEAARAGVSFLFEGAVMDGVPVFGLVRDTMPAVTIHGFRGIVNSTTNHILSALERGEAFEAALARMQADGVAEADPSLDVDGWDAAAKTSALANVLLDADLTPHLVAREGLDATTGDRARAAIRDGRRLKLVASARRVHGRVEGRVALESLDPRDPLAVLDGQANALELDTTPLGRIVITQCDGGLEKTAYALLADLVTVVKRLQKGQAR